jgi:hypothetical protein
MKINTCEGVAQAGVAGVPHAGQKSASPHLARRA